MDALMQAKIDKIKFTETEESNWCNKALKGREIDKIIKNMKNNKAPGHNLVCNEMIKGGDERQKSQMINALKLYLNTIWCSEFIPEGWKQGLIRPIYKDGDKSDPKNYRGIILHPILVKMFDAVMNDRITTETRDRIYEEQAGFRKGRSTVDHIFTLNEIINIRKKKTKKLTRAS